jgi:hypothetical protein
VLVNLLREPFDTPCYTCPFRHPSKKYNFTNEQLQQLAAGDFPCHSTRKTVPVTDYKGSVIAIQGLPTEASRGCAGAEYFRKEGTRFRTNK